MCKKKKEAHTKKKILRKKRIEELHARREEEEMHRNEIIQKRDKIWQEEAQNAISKALQTKQKIEQRSNVVQKEKQDKSHMIAVQIQKKLKRAKNNIKL